MKQLSNDEVREILPHRYPFLMIDSVVDHIPGSWAKCVKNVSAGEPYFQGHFPGKSVMPGVLILEALAQAGAIAVLSPPESRGKIALFGGVKNARFRRQVLPGDQLILECEIIKQKGPVGVGSGRATVNGEVACTADITFAITDASESK